MALAVAAFIIVPVVDYGIGLALSFADVPAAAEFLLREAFFLAAAVLPTAYAGYAWLNRRARWLSTAERAEAWDFGRLRALLAATLRPIAWVVPVLPFFALSLLSIFVLPQVEEALRNRGETLAPAWVALVATMRFGTRWWWIMLLPVAAWGYAAYSGRLLAQLGYVQDAPRE